MSLKGAVAAGVNAALNTVRDFMVEVDWTFVSSAVADYDPITDAYSTTSVTIPGISVLVYDDKDDDTQMMFSSRGNFVETPTQLDTAKILLGAADAGGRKPSIKDYFLWDGVKFIIDGFERVPGDSVFIMRVSRA